MGELSAPEQDPVVFHAIDLSTGWTFKQTDAGAGDDDGWLPVKQVPSTVHQDLIDNQKLEHPFVGLNEVKAEWVASAHWTYRLVLPAAADVRAQLAVAGAVAVLAFDGLDTFARVRLDGEVVLESDNMFVPQRVDVTRQLLANTSASSHRLDVSFEPALLRARDIQRQHPDHRYLAWNGDPARVAVRKAQYHWGWDWGPVLLTAGIWKPVRLEMYASRLADVRTDVLLSDDHQTATVTVSSMVEAYDGDDERRNLRTSVSIGLDGHGSSVIVTGEAEVDADGRTTTTLTIDRPRLWWPNGHGDQPLYRVGVDLLQAGVRVHADTKRIGIRTVDLVQQPDRWGRSFFLRINGRDVFCAGACWIPADSLLPNVTAARYRAWLELAARAHHNMVRVWGGGVYESDDFYDACDELGLLVWQDFAFACGNYPAWPDMRASVEAEARANVRRIRHHASLALLAGNNEDYAVQEEAQLQYDGADADEDHWLGQTDFPARYLYEALLPRVVAAEAPRVPYRPGSPWSDGRRPSSDPRVGDVHQWNVWHGTQEKYQVYDALGGRFISEFGMQALPHMATVRAFVGDGDGDDDDDDDDLHAQSRVLDFHNKATGHERRLATYLAENVRTTGTAKLEDDIYLTQLVQSEALTYAYRGWRKQWGDGRRGRQCGGALVWQLNDCWPATSWAIVDYYRRPKPAYYAIRRALAPVAVGVRRRHHDWSEAHARTPPPTQAWEVWAAVGGGAARQDITVDVEVRFIGVASGRDVRAPAVRRGLRLAANGTTERLLAGYTDNVADEAHVLAARLRRHDGGQLLARDADWPQPLKYLRFPARHVDVTTVQRGQQHQLRVSARRPVKCLVLAERDGWRLSDNAVDVMPGDDQVITVTATGPPDTAPPAWTWTYLGANEQ